MKISAIVELINRLLAMLGVFSQRRRNKERQAERDEIENDPVGWFNREFGGVRDDSKDSADAAKTDDERNGER